MHKDYITKIVSLSLDEDMGIAGDITTNALVPKKHASSAKIIAKSAGIISGLDFAREAFSQLDPKASFKKLFTDGQRVKIGQTLAVVKGSTRALLTGERVALNFLSYCSSIATQTRAFVDAVKPYKTQIMDTRKTTPLLRSLERYAVRCGGGVNHRFDLSSMALVKDNHRCVVKNNGLGLQQTVTQIKEYKNIPVEFEVDTLEELAEALLTKAEIILLDNMTPGETKQAVLMRNRLNKKILLESSGGITLKNVAKYAATGVERISIGALTHSRQALDISLDFCE